MFWKLTRVIARICGCWDPMPGFCPPLLEVDTWRLLLSRCDEASPLNSDLITTIVVAVKPLSKNNKPDPWHMGSAAPIFDVIDVRRSDDASTGVQLSESSSTWTFSPCGAVAVVIFWTQVPVVTQPLQAGMLWIQQVGKSLLPAGSGAAPWPSAAGTTALNRQPGRL